MLRWEKKHEVIVEGTVLVEVLHCTSEDKTVRIWMNGSR